jgi:hypothetical protein
LALRDDRFLGSEEQFDKEHTKAHQTKDTLRHMYHQMDAAFGDESIRRDAYHLDRVIWNLLEETTVSPPATWQRINTLHWRYRLIGKIIEVKMMREMGLTGKDEAADFVRDFTEKLEEPASEEVGD